MLDSLSPRSRSDVVDRPEAPGNTASGHQILTGARRGVHFLDTLRGGFPIDWIDLSRGFRRVKLDTWVRLLDVGPGWVVGLEVRDNTLGAQAGGAHAYRGSFELTSIPRFFGAEPFTAVETAVVRTLALAVFDEFVSIPGIVCDPDPASLRFTRVDVASDLRPGDGVSESSFLRAIHRSVPGFSTEYSWDGRVETVVSRPRARPGARSKGPVLDRVYDKARQMAVVHGDADYPRCIRFERQVRKSALPTDRGVSMLTDETLEAIGRECASNVTPGHITAESVLVTRALEAGIPVQQIQTLIGYLRTRETLGREMNRNTRVRYEQMALDLGVGGILDGADVPVSLSVDWDDQLIRLTGTPGL